MNPIHVALAASVCAAMMAVSAGAVPEADFTVNPNPPQGHQLFL